MDPRIPGSPLPLRQLRGLSAAAQVEELEQTFGPTCEVPLPPASRIRPRRVVPIEAIPMEAKGHGAEVVRSLEHRGELARALVYGERQPWWMERG